MTRDDILIAAARIFSEKGYHAASMQDIAASVNLQKASLYHHFNSKQEILLALLNQALELVGERLDRVLEAKIPSDEKLRRSIVIYLSYLAEHRDLSAVLLLEHRSLEPELRKKHIPARDRFERKWRDLILEGKQAGVFNCADPSLASRALLGVMNWSITWYRPDGPLPISEIADQFAQLFLRGLLARKG